MKSRRAKLEEQKMPAFGSDFLSAALGPRGCAPLGTPAGGCPPAPQSQERLRRPSGGVRHVAGVPGEEHPRHPAGSRVASVASRGRVLALRGAGRTSPLTRPALEKPPQARAGAWDGAVGVDGGQGSRSDRATAPALTPRNDPRSRLVAGVLFPQPPATWRTPRRAVGDDLAFEPLGFSNPRATASGAKRSAEVKLTGGVTPCSSRQQGRHGFPQETHLWRHCFASGVWGA